MKRWAARFDEQGEEDRDTGVRGRRPGEQTAVSAREQAWRQRVIHSKCTDKLRLPGFLLTREVVAELINHNYGVDTSLRALGNYLKRRGSSPQESVSRTLEHDSVLDREWTERV